MMRIGLYTNTALPLMGGQEHVVDALARQYVSLGHEPFVLAPLKAGAFETDCQLPYPVARHFPFVSTHRFVSVYGRALKRFRRTYRIDIIHAHSVYPSGYIASQNREHLDCPIVITGHGEHTSARRLQNPVLRERFAAAIAQADALISISDSIREGYINLCPDAGPRIVDLPNGVDVKTLGTPVARPPGLDDRIQPGAYFLFMGRLKPRKGVDVLIDAAAQLERDPMRIVIAGDGPERPALASRVRELGVSDDVIFTGAVGGDVKTWLYQNGRCLVAPSRVREGQPLVVLESFAAGRPVIASELPGFIGLVRPGETGRLVPAESPRDLADALHDVVEHPNRFDAMTDAVQAVARENSWRSIAQRHIDLYEDLLRTSASSR